MNEPRQKIMEALGEGGCYFLSLVHFAEQAIGERIDAVAVFLKAAEQRWSEEDGYLYNPEKILGSMLGGTWTVRKEGSGYAPAAGEVEVLRYERKTPGKIFSHFVLGDGKGGIAYDPYGDSRTVREGALVSKRIFRRV